VVDEASTEVNVASTKVDVPSTVLNQGRSVVEEASHGIEPPLKEIVFSPTLLLLSSLDLAQAAQLRGAK